MKIINIYEAKSQFSKLLAQVQQGQEITIAKNGQPIADLKPHQPKPNQAVKQAFGSMKGQFNYRDSVLVGIDKDVQTLFYGRTKGR
ncbi:type II toxin-antitoxin system prevent-host-death family antitoxin [Candidatus Parcubacteria bacterium]|nr:type II toxin-antitoxin system prevent-host-death family antitoxin [Candidatus Parcubacteria bacterium]